MNCVAKRVPGTQVFQPTEFELRQHREVAATHCEEPAYSPYQAPPSRVRCFDATDSNELNASGTTPIGSSQTRPNIVAAKHDDERDAEQTTQSRVAHKRPAAAAPAPASSPASLAQAAVLSRKCDNSISQSVAAATPRATLAFKRSGPNRRNSVESIQSGQSISSGTEPISATSASRDEQHDSSQAAASSSQEHRARPVTVTGGRVLVATRYVRPPVVQDDQLISAASDWKTISLTDDERSDGAKSPPSPLRAEPPAPLDDGRPPKSRRLESLVASCKMLASRRASCSGANSADTPALAKHSTSPETKQSPIISSDKLAGSPPADAKRSISATASSGGDGGSSPGRHSAPGRDRKESTLSCKSTGSRRAKKEQIGIRKAPFMFAGILGSILGSVFFSMGMLCIKLLPDDHGLAEKTKIVCFRGCIMMFLCGSTIVYQKSTFLIKRDELWVNALRSAFGFTGVYGAYISLKYISMGDSTALVFSSPIWTSLLSHFILNEPLQWIQLLALPASLVGIVFIAHPALLINMADHSAGATERQPLLEVVDVVEVADLMPLLNETNPAHNTTAQHLANLTQSLNRDLDISVNTHEQFDFEHRWKGIVIALGTSFIVSFVYIVLKFRKTTPIQTTTFWLGATTVGASLIVMSFIGLGSMPASWFEWTLLICNGICSWLGQVLLQWALAFEDASVLSVIRTLDVAMTFTLSALFLEEEILWTSILGAAIIAFVVVSIMLNSWLTKRLCPTRSATIADQDEINEFDSEHLAPNDNRRGQAICELNGQKPLQSDEDGNLTMKLEAPSIRKLRESEAAA